MIIKETAEGQTGVEPDPDGGALPVHIYFLLDRSYSMHEIEEAVLRGFNDVLTEQKATPGKCRFTLVQFDDEDPFEVVHEAIKLVEVPELTQTTFVPRGNTPLRDAEGKLIVMAETRAARRRDKGKQEEAILFVTFTDGKENCSKEWTFGALTAKKKEHERDWAFIYLGVGHDAYGQSAHIGTHAMNTTSAPAGEEGVEVIYAVAASEVTHTRERASKGMHTNSTQTRAATEAAEESTP